MKFHSLDMEGQIQIGFRLLLARVAPRLFPVMMTFCSIGHPVPSAVC